MQLSEPSIAEQLLIHFCQAYRARDLHRTLNLFTSNAYMWGTGVDETRQGLKEIEAQLLRDWSQSESGEIEIVSFAPVHGSALWAAAVTRAKLTIEGQIYSFDDLRGSIVIEEENGHWKICHMHSSFPDMRNAENNSFPT